MNKLNSLRLAWPTDWSTLFGAARPLILEIGFGYGAYLLHLARSQPDCSIIGLEIANQCLRAAEEAIERHRLANVRVIHSRAETALYHCFTPASLQEVHMNFPDPWFKKRHSRRRLMQRDTLDVLVNRLAPGGRLYLATDILAYAEMSAELLAATPGLDNLLPTPWANTMPGRTLTRYERKARRVGRDCHYFAYERNAQPAPVIPVVQETPMTHVVFQSPLTLADFAARFQPLEYQADDLHISLIRAYRGDRAVLFEVYVKEPTLDQHVALMLAERKTPGEYTLKTGSLGYPRATPGLHAVVRLLAEQLVALHPDSRMLETKLPISEEE